MTPPELSMILDVADKTASVIGTLASLASLGVALIVLANRRDKAPDEEE